MKKILSITIVILFFYACDNDNSNNKKDVTPIIAKDSIVPKALPEDTLRLAPVSVAEVTKTILTLIKNKDYKNFASYIHPVEGIRFSAYAYIDTAGDQHFSVATFSSLLAQKNKKLVWGSFDGSGDAIKMTLEEYFKRFVYDADFLNAEKTSVGKMQGGGNSLNNLYKIYPGLEFTESYFSGFDKKLEGMDWLALRLVYKNHEGKPYLVAVIHDQWTI